MYKIAAMGDRDSVSGFASIGLETFSPADESEAARLLRMMSEEGYAVVYITEKLASLIPEEIEKYREAVTPAVILIPGVTGNTGEGMQNVSRSVERAVGSDVLG